MFSVAELSQSYLLLVALFPVTLMRAVFKEADVCFSLNNNEHPSLEHRFFSKGITERFKFLPLDK